MKIRTYLTILLLLFLTKAFSCDCKPIKSIKNEFKSADAVFKGTVIKAEYKKKLTQESEYLDTIEMRLEKKIMSNILVNEYTVLIKKAFKNTLKNDTIIIRTALDPVTDCGLIMVKNTTYLFYAWEINSGNLWYDNSQQKLFSTSVCSRTKKTKYREEFLLKKYIPNPR
jgi:hypothetical protein